MSSASSIHVHTDGQSYLFDPSQAAYKAYSEMQVGDVIAWAGRPEAEIIEINAGTVKDMFGRDLSSHRARLADGTEGIVTFGPGGRAPVRLPRGLPDPNITGPCQLQASILCEPSAGRQRMDPMDMTKTETSFRAYVMCCQACYDVQADEYIRVTHGRA